MLNTRVVKYVICFVHQKACVLYDVSSRLACG